MSLNLKIEHRDAQSYSSSILACIWNDGLQRERLPFPMHFQGRQAYATCFGQWYMTDVICPVKAHFQQVIHHIHFLPASSTIQDSWVNTVDRTALVTTRDRLYHWKSKLGFSDPLRYGVVCDDSITQPLPITTQMSRMVFYCSWV